MRGSDRRWLGRADDDRLDGAVARDVSQHLELAVFYAREAEAERRRRIRWAIAYWAMSAALAGFTCWALLKVVNGGR